MTHFLNHIRWLSFLLLLAGAKGLASEFVIDDSRPWDGGYLGTHIEFKLVQGEPELEAIIQELNDGPLQVSQDRTLNFGMIRDTVLGRFTINSDRDREVVFHVDYFFLSKLVLYSQTASGWSKKSVGLKAPYSERELKTRSNSFLVPLKRGANQFYFRGAGNTSVQIPIRVWSMINFYRHETAVRSYVDVILGGLFLILIYNLFIYISLNETVFLSYSLFIATHLFYQIFALGLLPGLCHEIFNFDLMIDFMGSICVSVVVLATMLFIPQFLDIPRTSFLFKWVKVTGWLCVPTILTAPFLTYISTFACILIATVAIVLCVHAGIARIRKGDTQLYVKIYCFAWCFYMLGASSQIANFMNLLPLNLVTQYSQVTFLILKICLLSLAQANKLKGFKATIHAEQKAKAHSYDQLMKVFYPHQLSMIKSGYQLEQTMPTHAGEACVISFDIMSSSRIQHEKAKDFFRSVFRRCNEIMMEGYDGLELRAGAYRIKELGDGFLCSVGYPFRSPHGSIAQGAYELALKFHDVFQQEARHFQLLEPVHCGIGIAMDSIAGFYPETGAREYDLYGRAIVLATRYEGMRKVLLKNAVPESILILQDQVHKNLDSILQGDFNVFDLQAHNEVVRDDPKARQVYYQMLTSMGTTQKSSA
ncbi:MAG TPA: 7TM diverse intracellular signaling domain-containing protein [Oligoflexus sp.]|uniref:7TM diverse intracellular signaling domain-containing protein n=1 Tax=Oligoflexus sp. TaxID=1971216 RepID=UPI002D493C66|nr:7TM diverse intracellular signaling domain-containing protein [Oligoflexus sp.]HYX35204.1 7TM diverse intracellular signaling domain-containing protein [Oligoflexus sp.]